MDDASALVAWGRQVLANRRLTKQRERLARETMQFDLAVQRENAISVPSTTASCGSPHRSSGAAAGSGGSSGCHAGSQPRTVTVPNIRPDVAHLKRRVEVAKQWVQELQALEGRNFEAFQRRQEELQNMVEQSRQLPHLSHHSTTPSPPVSRPSLEKQPSYKEQLNELLSLQKALLRSRQEEKLSGAAMVTFTTCADSVKDWDSQLWRLLREALSAWRFQLLPSLYRFAEIVQKPSAPYLSLPPSHDDHPHESPSGPNGKSDQGIINTSSIDANRGEKGDDTVGGENLECGANTCGDTTMVLPAIRNYRALEQLEKLPLEEAIGLAIGALSRAGAETLMSVSSVKEHLEREDAELVHLLMEAERQVELHAESIVQSRSLFEKLQSEKAGMEEDGVVIDNEIEKLQQKVFTLQVRHEQQEREQKEQAEVLQRLQSRLEDVKQKIQRETVLRSNALEKTDRARQAAQESVQQRRMLLEEELPRVESRKASLEAEVLQLRRAARVAREEESEAAEQRQKLMDELRVAEAAQHVLHEELLRRRQLHEDNRAELLLLKCREQELHSQMNTANEECNNIFTCIEMQRAVEANLQVELEGIRSEVVQHRKEVEDLRRAIRRTEAQQEEAESRLLYGVGGAANTTSTELGSVKGTPTQRSLGDVLRLEKKGSGDRSTCGADAATTPASEVSTSRPLPVTGSKPLGSTTMLSHAIPQARSEAMEVLLTPRGVQREVEELRMVHLRNTKERNCSEKQDSEGPFPVVVVACSADPSPSHQRDDKHHVPLSVERPSRRGAVAHS